MSLTESSYRVAVRMPVHPFINHSMFFWGIFTGLAITIIKIPFDLKLNWIILNFLEQLSQIAMLLHEVACN